jgi:hypothetical protein
LQDRLAQGRGAADLALGETAKLATLDAALTGQLKSGFGPRLQRSAGSSRKKDRYWRYQPIASLLEALALSAYRFVT